MVALRHLVGTYAFLTEKKEATTREFIYIKTPMESRGDIREDFIRRLFAVAVSVGFATTIVQMDWVKNGTVPRGSEGEQLAILGTGMALTVLSWDGYLASIQNKPLNDYPRFLIDITLVFIYMFFLISSKQSDFWLPILALVYALYFMWDILTVREHPDVYGLKLESNGTDRVCKASIGNVLCVYLGGFLGRPKINRGPIITISWATYFATLMLLNYSAAEYQVYIMAGFASLGLLLYRIDKGFRSSQRKIAGFPM